MGENLSPFLAIGMMIAGMALVAYAGYLQYVALPEEHAPRHVLTRTALFVGGLVLVLLGAVILR